MKKNTARKPDSIKPQEDPADLDTCTMAPEFAEHARPNEPAMEPCDDGRAGALISETPTKKEGQEKKEQCRDIVNQRKEERQHTMDKMSLHSSEAHTYDKSKEDGSEQCS